jgi:uncharacterized protein YbjT (DUF2867 family)
LNPEKYGGKDYLLTGPAAISDDELLNIFGNALGKEVAYINHTGEEFRQVSRKEGSESFLGTI